MKIVIARHYPTLLHRPTDTRFESRVIDIDKQGAAFVGVAEVEDAVAEQHFMNREGFHVFEHDAALMAGTARKPATASTEDVVTREPTEAELQHAAEANEEAERAAAVRAGEQVPAKPKKGAKAKAEKSDGDKEPDGFGGPAGSGTAGDGAKQ